MIENFLSLYSLGSTKFSNWLLYLNFYYIILLEEKYIIRMIGIRFLLYLSRDLKFWIL